VCGWRGDLGVSGWKVRGEIFLGVLKWPRWSDGFYLAGQVGSRGFASPMGGFMFFAKRTWGAGSFLKISVMHVPSLPGFESIADFRVLIWFVDASFEWRMSRPEFKCRHSVTIEDVIVATCAECTDVAQSHPE
jgi:hypothetical protein